jgi:hypothetical protein
MRGGWRALPAGRGRSSSCPRPPQCASPGLGEADDNHASSGEGHYSARPSVRRATLILHLSLLPASRAGSVRVLDGPARNLTARPMPFFGGRFPVILRRRRRISAKRFSPDCEALRRATRLWSNGSSRDGAALRRDGGTARRKGLEAHGRQPPCGFDPAPGIIGSLWCSTREPWFGLALHAQAFDREQDSVVGPWIKHLDDGRSPNARATANIEIVCSRAEAK